MITYSHRFVAFLHRRPCKIARLLNGAYMSPFPVYRLLLTADAINYLTLTETGGVSYLPADKIPYDDDDEDDLWRDRRRQEGKAAKTIRKVFTEKALKHLTDVDFEDFANAVKSYMAQQLHFRLLPNVDIGQVYDRDHRGGGSLQNSCMNYESQWLEVYETCPVLRILVLEDENDLLCGRALIWNVDDGNITLMDRIYVSDDYMYDLFIDYAIKNGWWRKKRFKTFEDKMLFIRPDGVAEERRFTVPADTSCDEMPYIDTFTYGTDNSLNNYGHGRYCFDEIDGSRHIRAWDDINNCFLDPGDIFTITAGVHAGASTAFDNTVDCDGQVWWRHDPEIVDINGAIYHVSQTVWSAFGNCHYLSRDAVWSAPLNSHILSMDAITIDGAIYHRDALPEPAVRA